MIMEIATLTIDPLRADAFEQAVADAVPFFKATPGCHGMALERLIEEPETYILRVLWETLEHHMTGFRESANFQKWRAMAGPFFVEPPRVVHLETKAQYF